MASSSSSITEKEEKSATVRKINVYDFDGTLTGLGGQETIRTPIFQQLYNFDTGKRNLGVNAARNRESCAEALSSAIVTAEYELEKNPNHKDKAEITARMEMPEEGVEFLRAQIDEPNTINLINSANIQAYIESQLHRELIPIDKIHIMDRFATDEKSDTLGDKGNSLIYFMKINNIKPPFVMFIPDDDKNGITTHINALLKSMGKTKEDAVCPKNTGGDGVEIMRFTDFVIISAYRKPGEFEWSKYEAIQKNEEDELIKRIKDPSIFSAPSQTDTYVKLKFFDSPTPAPNNVASSSTPDDKPGPGPRSP